MFRSSIVVVFFISVFTCAGARGQTPTPAGFHWVDFKQEVPTVAKIERALKDESYTAIREIGVTDAFALVLTVHREPDQTTFYGDEWRVYSISTKTWTVRSLLSGYDLQVKDWVRFQQRSAQDLGVVYKECWECEPASLFTAMHYDSHNGWRARWANEKDPNHPGITMQVTDVGDPYTNEDVDQVFAVTRLEEGSAIAGTWYRSKDLSTGKITESVKKFWVDQATGRDKSAELSGTDAKTWEVILCKPHSPYGLSQGQDTRACKRMAGVTGKTSP